jgi:hypothetical protein
MAAYLITIKPSFTLESSPLTKAKVSKDLSFINSQYHQKPHYQENMKISRVLGSLALLSFAAALPSEAGKLSESCTRPYLSTG